MSPELTAILAIWGASLSTLTAMIRIIEFFRNRTRIVVRARTAVFDSGTGLQSKPVICIEIINKGSKPVVLSSLGWLQKNKRRLAFQENPGLKLPHILEPGRSTETYRLLEWFRTTSSSEVENITGVYVKDQTDKDWIGKIKGRQKQNWLTNEEDGIDLQYFQNALMFPDLVAPRRLHKRAE